MTFLEPVDAYNEMVRLLREIRTNTTDIKTSNQEISSTLGQFYASWLLANTETPQATDMVLTIAGGNMTTFTVDTTDGTANLQFVDDHGDPVQGPLDSVTGSPVVPVVTSDNEAVITVGDATDVGITDGLWTAPLTPVAEGTANIGVAALANSDGSPVNAPDGSPFPLPASVEVTVTAGAAAGLTLTVTG